MLRSMSSAITGLTLNQTALDVIGNNIANMGTTGYKAQTLTFSDSLSQSMRDPNAPSPTYGGSNGIQIGLGAGIAGISTLLTQGNFQPTSRNLDNAIDGDGYFAVAEGPTMFNDGTSGNKESITVDKATHGITDNPRGANVMYTRDGSFNLDQDGNLVTSSGLRVLGYSLIDNNVPMQESIANDGKINFVDANAVDANKYSTVRVNKSELRSLRIPDVIYKGANAVKVKNFSIDKSGLIKAVLDDGSTSVVGQIATTSFANPAGLVKLGNNAVQSSPNSGPAIFKSGYVAKYNDSPAEGIQEINSLKITTTGTKAGKITVTVDSNTVDVELADGDNAVTIASKIQSALAADTKINADYKVTCTTDGEVVFTSNTPLDDKTVTFSTKDTDATKPTGVSSLSTEIRKGAKPNSDDAKSMANSESVLASADNSKGFGSIQNGVLEMSNVDIAEQFTKMIEATRSFQANGKMITTGDEILQDLVNLKR